MRADMAPTDFGLPKRDQGAIQERTYKRKEEIRRVARESGTRNSERNE